MQIEFFLVLFLLFGCFSSALSAAMCPTVCEKCYEHFISCASGGLEEFPQELYTDTKKIVLIGHTFSQSSLSRQNFSRLAKPKFSIEQLSIRRSNINVVHTNAFFDLSGLDSLDLSDNLQLKIESRAFDNLKLKFLSLDGISRLSLSATAFEGLMVASLSIKKGHLQNFPYELVAPLSKDLRKLFLSTNDLRHLSSQLDALFRQLTILDLHGNPLLCNCGLLWLSTTLRWRQKHLKTQSDELANIPRPSCAGPLHLFNETVDAVDEKDFECQPPKLNRIEIQFENIHRAVLRCAASMQGDKAPLNISWTYLDDEVVFPRVISSVSGREATIVVDRRLSVDKFLCSMRADSGNASVNVHLGWPRASKWIVNVSSRAPPSYEQNFFFREQYTLLELLASVVGTFIATMVLFIVIYRFYFYKAIKLKKEQLKKSGYDTYEVELYSDSQTYDIPQYPSLDQRNKMLHSVFTLPQPSKPLVDYTNHQRR